MVVPVTSDIVYSYLLEVLDDFPFLRDNVDLSEYTRKLGATGEAFASIYPGFDGELSHCQGIVAGYFNNPAGSYSYVSILHVRKESRNSTLGRQLMDRAMEHSRNLGLPVMKLHVNKINKTALEFYRHIGFRIVAATDRKFELRIVL